MKNKKLIIIIAVCVVVALAGAVVGINCYNSYAQQQKIEKLSQDIDNTLKIFENAKSRNEKYTCMSEFVLNGLATKDESEKVLTSIQTKYNETVNTMQKWFTDDYNKTLQDNTVKTADLKNFNDKDKLRTYTSNLNSLASTVISEKGVVFRNSTSDEAQSYVDKAAELIKSYSDRLDEIQVAEAEAKAKAEEDRKATEPDTKKTDKNNDNNSESSSGSESNNSNNNYNENNSYNDSGNGSSNNSYDYNYDYNDNNNSGSNNYNYDSGNSSSNSNSSNRNWTWSYTNENGTSYFDDEGNAWDDEGHTWNYKDLW